MTDTKFKAGQSGNPGGRPRGLSKLVRDTVKAAAGQGRDGWVEVVKAQYDIATGVDEEAKPKDMTAAATWLRDSGFGRPQQSVDLTTGGEKVNGLPSVVPLPVAGMSDEMLASLRATLTQAKAVPADEDDDEEGDPPVLQ